jgi:hypothetical protein
LKQQIQNYLGVLGGNAEYELKGNLKNVKADKLYRITPDDKIEFNANLSPEAKQRLFLKEVGDITGPHNWAEEVELLEDPQKAILRSLGFFHNYGGQ